jgi:POT family proton-dependent oligopeptide transporter
MPRPVKKNSQAPVLYDQRPFTRQVRTSRCSLSTTTPSRVAEVRDDRMPAGIPYIVSNEFAERFCFYGINSILTIYLVQFMHFTDAKSASWQSLFKSGAYFFPMIGAVVSDVFWGKFRTIMTFSLVYCAGCVSLALFSDTPTAVGLGLLMVAFGTGGIKPCVSTNVGDQFSSKNQHLIERAFSWFYLAINAGSSISIYFCPVLLASTDFGPKWAFGMPAAMMFLATFVFWLGRKKFVVVPPAGKAWLKDVFSPEGVKLIGSLVVIYFFVACFWMLWDQSNGNTWTLQAQSSLMDKNLGFGLTLLPAQIQVVNGLLILALVPVFTFVIYPICGRFFEVTPLRRIGAGLFTVASSFLIVAWIEQRIQSGHSVSAWWQILAYVVLTAAEVLVSITALEFSYKQAPLRMKSFVMALFLLSTSLGNLMIAGVNSAMVKPLHASAIEAGEQTWVSVAEAGDFVTGQKIDFTGNNGIQIVGGEKAQPLEGTFLVAEIDAGKSRVRLMDVVERAPLKSTGVYQSGGEVATYRLVGPNYFYFFFAVMTVMGVIFIFVAMVYKEKTHVRVDA